MLWNIMHCGETKTQRFVKKNNSELKQWELCDGEKKITSLDSGLAEYASENDDTYNNDYTNDYVIVESDSSLSWAEIE